MDVPSISGLFHVGITVRDMNRALAFYRDLLGLTVVSDRVTTEDYIRRIVDIAAPSIRVAFLAVPGSDARVELLHYAAEADVLPPSPPSLIGTGHLCFFTSSIAEVDRRLRSAGAVSRSGEPVEITAGPNAGCHAVYFSDPDGHWIEFIQRP